MFAKKTEFCVARGRILCATRIWRHNCPPDRRPKKPSELWLAFTETHEIRKRSPSSNAKIIYRITDSRAITLLSSEEKYLRPKFSFLNIPIHVALNQITIRSSYQIITSKILPQTHLNYTRKRGGTTCSLSAVFEKVANPRHKGCERPFIANASALWGRERGQVLV